MNKDVRKMCTRKKLLYKRAKRVVIGTYGISVNVKYNPKKFWSKISSLRKDCDNTCSTINGTTVSNPSDIADEFNNHFSSKFDGIYIYIYI